MLSTEEKRDYFIGTEIKLNRVYCKYSDTRDIESCQYNQDYTHEERISFCNQMRKFEEECYQLSMEDLIDIWFHPNSIERLSIASHTKKAVLFTKYDNYFNRIYQLPQDCYDNYFVEQYTRISDKYPVLGYIQSIWKNQQSGNGNNWDFKCLKPVLERMTELKDIYSIPKIISSDSDSERDNTTTDSNESKRLAYNKYKQEKIECENCGRMVTRGNYSKHQETEMCLNCGVRDKQTRKSKKIRKLPTDIIRCCGDCPKEDTYNNTSRMKKHRLTCPIFINLFQTLTNTDTDISV